jgi:3-methylcrotonyl-CoA carboxylase alpha subunit
MKPFESVLVVNRGEIAVRVMRTCRRLGVRTIAVYSDADARSMHVAQADEAHRIGPAPASESYLNGAALLRVARAARASAVHPGYGFLAENPEFAQACLDAGLAWIGPPPSAMRALGDKAAAKRLAEAHDVPLLPGYHGDDQSLERLGAAARDIGYPVLIKASAGGGGRGMRAVDSPEEFAEALEAARREARASFGDERVLLERYVRQPRHVEVQVLADRHGHAVHLGERECSIQRRHQKLIEESPSPAVDDALRREMGEAAIKLVRAAGYENAGTVEFLLDEAGRFAFLEVNARLQVEHPVTELVTGLDLVEQQLLIASGSALAFGQDDVALTGHAIEARVIAEDALAGFLPSSGVIARFEVPASVRVDTWVTDGSVVSPYYDSLLAKVIAGGATRRVAVDGLANALAMSIVDGVQNNIDLLLSTLEHPAFLAGALHTGFLDEHAIVDELASLPDEALAIAAAHDFHAAPWRDPWRGPSAWRLARVDQPAVWLRTGRPHAARVADRLDGTGLDVHLASGADVQVSTSGHVTDHQTCRLVHWRGRTYRLQRPPRLSIEATVGQRGAGGRTGRLTAPMPGRIVKISVQPGQHVRPNEPLLVLEAMKMEHVVEAPHAAAVREVCVAVGEQVAAGAVLLDLGDEQ